MVSGTRCPAWSDQVKKWSESRAAAPKGRCPVGHRGEPLRMSVSPYKRADFEPKRADLGPKIADLGPKRADFSPEILGLRGVVLGLRGVILGLKEPYWGLRSLGGGTDRRTDGQTYVMVHPCVLQDIGPLGPLLKK